MLKLIIAACYPTLGDIPYTYVPNGTLNPNPGEHSQQLSAMVHLTRSLPPTLEDIHHNSSDHGIMIQSQPCETFPTLASPMAYLTLTLTLGDIPYTYVPQCYA